MSKLLLLRSASVRASVGLLAALLSALSPGVSAAQEPAPAAGAYDGYLAVRVRAVGAPEGLDALRPDTLFVPASVLKVVTVAAALEHLGPAYRWVTRITTTGDGSGPVLDGDLVIDPGADPTWHAGRGNGDAARPLTELARQVRASGITRVRGDLVVDTTRFPGRMHPTDRGFADLPYRFGTPPAALALDDATIVVRVAAGPALGTPARVAAPDGVEVINLTTTVGPDRRGQGTLDFVPVWGTDTLLLRGEYPITEPAFVVAASDPAPVRRTARRLRAALVEAGVAVDGEARLATPADAGLARTVVAAFSSPPLEEVLDRMLTESHNWTADMLTLTLGREVAGTGRFDDGVDVVADFVERVTGTSDARGAWLEDGSGLSPSNLVTPRTVVEVLAYAVGQPWGQTLVAALARPGQGTLASWPTLPPLAAKTGTLRHTVALAGVVDSESGTPILFCYFVNHQPERAADARRAIAAAVRRWQAGRAVR